MNGLTEEQMDKIIKSKFKNDNFISDKANSVFANFDSKQFNSQAKNNSAKQSETVNDEQSVRHDPNNKEKHNNSTKTNGKIIEVTFYQKMNRILSVAAVSLTVVLVGGSALYFNKGGNIFKKEPQTIIYNESSLVQNEKLELSNEKILKEVEQGYVKVYMLGKKDIGINLKSVYWDKYGAKSESTDCYKVENITENVSDIFIGEISGYGVQCVFLLMEDGTIQYIDLNCYTNGKFHFVATKLEGLTDVVGFEQKSRKFAYSNTDYKYVNAIRSDGLRKEIELGIVNNWTDKETVNYNKLNEKYIKAHNKESIVDDGTGDFKVGDTEYWRLKNEKEYVYYKKDEKLYRVRQSDYSEECLATGAFGMVRTEGGFKILLSKEYEIFILDKNIKYVDENNQEINEVTTKKQNNELDNNTQNQNKEYNPYIELAETRYQKQDFRSQHGTTLYVYEIEFDKYIRPTITISRVVNDKKERLYYTKNIKVANQDYAAGTTYVTFEFTAGSNDGDVNGSAQIKYSNVAENNEIGLKVQIEDNGKTYDFNNNDDFIYLNKQ